MRASRRTLHAVAPPRRRPSHRRSSRRPDRCSPPSHPAHPDRAPVRGQLRQHYLWQNDHGRRRASPVHARPRTSSPLARSPPGPSDRVRPVVRGPRPGGAVARPLRRRGWPDRFRWRVLHARRSGPLDGASVSPCSRSLRTAAGSIPAPSAPGLRRRSTTGGRRAGSSRSSVDEARPGDGEVQLGHRRHPAGVLLFGGRLRRRSSTGSYAPGCDLATRTCARTMRRRCRRRDARHRCRLHRRPDSSRPGARARRWLGGDPGRGGCRPRPRRRAATSGRPGCPLAMDGGPSRFQRRPRGSVRPSRAEGGPPADGRPRGLRRRPGRRPQPSDRRPSGLIGRRLQTRLQSHGSSRSRELVGQWLQPPRPPAVHPDDGSAIVRMMAPPSLPQDTWT